MAAGFVALCCLPTGGLMPTLQVLGIDAETGQTAGSSIKMRIPQEVAP